MKHLYTTIISLLIFAGISNAQQYTFSEFTGVWHGTISSENWGYSYPSTLEIFNDGFYTESSGQLMPTIYPNTQSCDLQMETNRFHFQYLKTVYAGQYFYQHFYYEIMQFENDTLVMHYNFWDDPEPHPEVQTLFYVRESTLTGQTEISEETEKKVISVTDITGREIHPDTRGVIMIIRYSDGTSEKKYIY